MQNKRFNEIRKIKKVDESVILKAEKISKKGKVFDLDMGINENIQG